MSGSKPVPYVHLEQRVDVGEARKSFNGMMKQQYAGMWDQFIDNDPSIHRGPDRELMTALDDISAVLFPEKEERERTNRLLPS